MRQGLASQATTMPFPGHLQNFAVSPGTSLRDSAGDFEQLRLWFSGQERISARPGDQSSTPVSTPARGGWRPVQTPVFLVDFGRNWRLPPAVCGMILPGTLIRDVLSSRSAPRAAIRSSNVCALSPAAMGVAMLAEDIAVVEAFVHLHDGTPVSARRSEWPLNGAAPGISAGASWIFRQPKRGRSRIWFGRIGP